MQIKRTLYQAQGGLFLSMSIYTNEKSIDKVINEEPHSSIGSVRPGIKGLQVETPWRHIVVSLIMTFYPLLSNGKTGKKGITLF